MKKNRGNIISIMTECGVCERITTKRNLREGVYLCHACNEFYSPEKIAEINQMLNKMGENWDEDEMEKFLAQLYKLED